jgi:hypothetical protein
MNSGTKKLKARDEFVRFTEHYLKERFAKLNPVQQSFALTQFYIKEIHNRIRSEISDEDLELAIVDGSKDLGCDLIHKDDGHVIVVQAKYRSPGTKEPAEPISHFQSILKRLADPALIANERLSSQLSTIDLKNDTFDFIYVTFGSLNHNNQPRKITEQKPNYPDQIKDIEQRCSWTYLDETDLNEALRGALALEQGVPDKTRTLYPTGQKGKRGSSSVIELKSGEYRSFIMALDARQIIGAYEELGRDALFSLNIRNFIGNTATNKEIVVTARDHAENFFLFNNGISCVCTKLEIHEDKIEVVGLQVINGAQTVKALVNAGKTRMNKSDPWSNYIPQVLVRITEIPGGYGKSGKIREQVTQFNNTQNTVKISDFRSNDKVQEFLKEQFKQIARHGRHVSYVPKRTDLVPKNAEVVRLEEFAKSVYAFLVDPISFSGATSFLFNDDSSGGYNKIFGDGEAKWEKMPEEEFRLRAAIYWIAQEFATYMRKDRDAEIDPDVRAALERKWMLLYATRKVFEHYYPNDAWKIQLQKLYKGDWELGVDAKGKLLLRIYRDARAGVVSAYKNAKKYQQGFVHRNWMRNRETPGEIAEILRDSVLAVRDPIGDVPT